MAKVKFTLEADNAKAVQQFLQLTDAQRKAELGFKKAALSGKKQNKGLTVMAGSLKTLGASLLSVTAIVGGLTKAFSAMAEERKRAAEGAKSTAFSLGELAQLAGGDRKVFKELLSRARTFGVAAGIKDKTLAGQIQFATTSQGLEGIRDEMIALIRGGVIKPEDAPELIKSVGVFRTAFGAEETGTGSQILAKLLKGSARSQTSITGFGPSATIFAQEAKKIGASDEESLAILSVIGNALKSVDIASTTLASLSASMRKMGISGEGYLGALPALKERLSGMTEAEVIKEFGRKEAERAYSAIVDNLPAIQKELAEMREVDRMAGTSQGLVSRTVGLYATDERLKAASDLRQKEAKLAETEEETLAVKEMSREQTMKDIRQQSLDRGEDPFNRAVQAMIANIVKWGGGSPEAMKGAADFWDQKVWLSNDEHEDTMRGYDMRAKGRAAKKSGNMEAAAKYLKMAAELLGEESAGSPAANINFQGE
jgi:hypothetical protein